MSDLVQAYDPNTGDYVAIEVRTNRILDRRKSPFKNTQTGELMEEIEPLELEQPLRMAASDPLNDFR